MKKEDERSEIFMMESIEYKGRYFFPYNKPGTQVVTMDWEGQWRLYPNLEEGKADIDRSPSWFPTVKELEGILEGKIVEEYIEGNRDKLLGS